MNPKYKTLAKLDGALAVAALIVSCLPGCSKEEPRQATAEEQRNEAVANGEKNQKLQNMLEQQRSVALQNASSNAANYFAANPRFDAGWKTISHTDDYISPSCPQGSGWAWSSMMKVEGKDVQKNRVYCSTSSASVGCFIEADFNKGPYAAQGSKCDPNLPYPLKPFK